MTTMKIGLVGCGNIATDVCIAIRDKALPAEVVALTDIDIAQAQALQQAQQLRAAIGTLAETAAACDLLVECATGVVVPDVLRAAIANQVECLVMSVGGLLGQDDLLAEARRNGVHVRIPTGAICGLDGIRAALQAGLDSVELTTRKPPRGLAGAPYLQANNIDVEGLEAPLVVFDGTAADAVKAFPANVNVAAALSLAGIGPDKTRVRVVADHAATTNTHEIRAVGPFGELTTVTRNLPSPRNPKSSYMASLSAIAEVAAAVALFATRDR